MHQRMHEPLNQVSGPADVMAGTDDAPGQAQFVVRVNPNNVPKLPAGGVVIGRTDAAPEIAQNERDSGGDQ